MDNPVGIGKLFGGRSSVFDVKSEVKKIVFDNETMKPITCDAGLFTMVMATFSTFEEFGKPDATHVNELLRRFSRYLEASFPFEFPFYLILVYRLRKFRQLYDCEELGPFLTKCIDMFEILPTHQLAQTLLTFLNKNDFDVMFGSEPTNSSVFTLLATAARDLMNLSIQIKRSNRHSASSKRTIYCRLLWISVFLKCLSEKGIVTRMDLTIWNKEFIFKISEKTPITKDMIDDFKLGLELSKLLKLPTENQFTTHHLGCFLADEKSIRPFAYARDVVIGLEEFITSDKELLVHILINLRAIYTNFLKASDSAIVGMASIDGTLLGTIDEGISFLDNITELWTRKGWHKGEQHGDFRAECLKWMMLLLGAVRVTDPNAPQLLKKFLAPKRGSIIADRAYRSKMVQSILEKTRAKFPDLTIQQFHLLYNSFRIWPVAFLRDYLKQYQIPVDVNIADPTWSEFFVEVLNRYSNNEIQNFIMDFIIKVAEKYHRVQKSFDFIPDILQLNVPILFTLTFAIEDAFEEDDTITNRFTDFLKDYIKRKTLRPVIIERIQEILSLALEDKQPMFHWIVLNVLLQEVIPESLQDDSIETKQFKDLLKLSVNTVSQKVSWFGVLSPRQRFCWGVISAGCSKIPISAESFEWVISLQSVISQLGSVFNSYCNSRQLLGHTCLLTESLPQEVVECMWDDVRNYFNWIRQVQNILRMWQDKFLWFNVNFDEILIYTKQNLAISSLGKAVCASEYVMDLQDIQGSMESFMMCFEQLNCYLIKYIPNHPESKYCTLVELLLCYGVHFPSDLQQKFQGKVIFPGNERDIPDGQKLSNVINASAHSQFEPGQDISLVITKSLSLHDLQRILEDLQTFLEPIIEHMDMLVFFHLEKSDIFSKHLHKRLNNLITAAASPRVEQRTFTALPSFNPSLYGLSNCDKTKVEGVSMTVLHYSLKGVKDLLFKVLRGKATYSDIVAGNTLNLHKLKIEEEFDKLRRFSEQLEMNCEGLEEIRSMLELSQFTHRIEQIRQVCEQFQLTKCLQDNQFKNLLEIVKEFETVESHTDLTAPPTEALEKMGIIKKALCLEHLQCDSSCLQVFTEINCTSFYYFIKAIHFHGHESSTAQLQDLLEHLPALLQIITPFMDKDISFSDLMKDVVKLSGLSCLKHLEKVKEITSFAQMFVELQSCRNNFDTEATESQVMDELPKKDSKMVSQLMRNSFKMYEEQKKQMEQEALQLKQTIAEQKIEIAALNDALMKQKQIMSQENQAHEEQIEALKLSNSQEQTKLQEEKENHQKLMVEFSKLQAEQERLVKAHSIEIEELNSIHQHEKQAIEERANATLSQLQKKINEFELSWKICNKDIAMTNEKLGKGAWGGVAVGVYREDRVAVKQLHDLIVEESTLAVVNREIDTMSRLRHPNLLLFIGAVLDHPSGNPLIITEIMDTSLRRAYEKGKVTEETSKLSILKDTASGLNYLHCHHDEIIHRDVSSANVLLESRGTNKWRAKLSDFGSANIARNAITQAPGAQVYSAPEALVAITDETPCPQTTKMDVYSYGILTCEVMSCRFPDRTQFQSMLVSVQANSPSIGRIVRSCTMKNPSDRPTMTQVIKLLQ